MFELSCSRIGASTCSYDIEDYHQQAGPDIYAKSKEQGISVDDRGGVCSSRRCDEYVSSPYIFIYIELLLMFGC